MLDHDEKPDEVEPSRRPGQQEVETTVFYYMGPLAAAIPASVRYAR
jgi:hypothetical protein